MTALDLDFIRGQFPAFAEPSLQGFAHFDNAGGSYACRQTVDWLDRYYRQTKVQPYNDYPASRLAGKQMDAAKERVAAWLNVGSDELHLGPSTSQNTYVVAQALRERLTPGDEVIVTNQDHEANVGVWARLASAGIVIREWQVDPDTAAARTAPVSRRCSTAHPGGRLPARFQHCRRDQPGAGMDRPRAPCRRPHDRRRRLLLPARPARPRVARRDIYLFSAYKVYGPHLGVMYVRRDFAGELPHQGHFFNAAKPEYRLTPAGADHAQVAAVNGVMDYLDSVADRHGCSDKSAPARANAVRTLIRDHESALLQPLLDHLSKHPRVRMIGKDRAAERAPTVAFTVDNHRSAELASRLSEFDLGVGAGHFYAYRLVKALNIATGDGVVRASFVHYTSAEEITRLISALEAMV